MTLLCKGLLWTGIGKWPSYSKFYCEDALENDPLKSYSKFYCEDALENDPLKSYSKFYCEDALQQGCTVPGAVCCSGPPYVQPAPSTVSASWPWLRSRAPQQYAEDWKDTRAKVIPHSCESAVSSLCPCSRLQLHPKSTKDCPPKAE